MDRIVIGTRGSALALWQAAEVERMLRAAVPGIDVVQQIIKTTGDRILDRPLAAIGDKGLFTHELESALREGRIDIAVHSLKDLPTRLPEGLTIGAITRRHHAEDVLVARPGMTIASLPEGGTVATGSLRRRSQLLHERPDLCIVDVRGNVPTRIEKFVEFGWDGMLLAYAGLDRLGLGDQIAQVLPPTYFIPAVGQGALGVESRADDPTILNILQLLDHLPTRRIATAERAALRALEGGCQAPIGAYATIDGEDLTIIGFVASLDGREIIRRSERGAQDDAEAIGTALAEAIRVDGGDRILGELRSPA